MKLKRILATLVAVAMAVSIVPMTFAATAGVDIDFDTTTGFAEWRVASGRATNNEVTGVYGNNTKSMNISSPVGKSFVGAVGVRAYEEDVAVSKTATRLSFKIAAADKNSRKAVSFDTGAATPGTSVFEMSTDGKMYVLGTEICAYDTERWYQVDLIIKSTGAFEAYIDGGSVNPSNTTGTAAESAVLTDIFGKEETDVEDRNLYYYMCDKSDSTVTSDMYVDDFKTETSDSDSEASVPDSGKLIFTYAGSATFANGMMSNLGDNPTVESILADYTVTKGSVKIFDINGQEVTTGAVVPGMKIVLSSANAAVKLEYALDCLNLVFTVPGEDQSTRDLTKTISATFNGTAEVEFYVNGAKKATVTTAPYEYTVEHMPGTGGLYEVYAEVVLGEARYTTEKKSYTFVENSVPTLTIPTNYKNAGIAKTETVIINISAEDADYTESGLEYIELYFDGQLVASKTAEAANTQTLTLDNAYVASGLSVGTHSYYAKTEDADGAEVTSETITFSVVESVSTDIDNATFEDGNESIMGEYHPGIDAQLATIAEPGNETNHVKANTGSKSTMFMVNDAGKFSGAETIYWEMDIKTSNPNSNDFLEVRTENSGEKTTTFNIKELGMAANQWYRVKYVVDAVASKQEVYLSSDGGATWTFVTSEQTDVTLGGKVKSTRVYINRNSAADYYIYLDNIHMYKVDKSAFVSDVKYLNANGSDINNGDGTVAAEIKSVEITYSNAVGDYFFGEAGNNAKGSFVITDGDGNEVTRFSANAEGTKITITFDTSLAANTTYTITPVRSGEYGFHSALLEGTPANFTFTTGAKAVSVISDALAADGTGGAIVVKGSGNVSIYYAVYSGDKLIYFGKQAETLSGTNETVAINAATQVGSEVSGEETTVKLFFWNTADRAILTDAYVK